MATKVIQYTLLACLVGVTTSGSAIVAINNCSMNTNARDNRRPTIDQPKRPADTLSDQDFAYLSMQLLNQY